MTALARNRIVVVGGGGHAKVLIGLLRKLQFDVVGYTDQRDRGDLLGVRHLGSDDVLGEVRLREGVDQAVMGVGKVDASPLRRRLVREVSGLGFDFPVVISPQAVVNENVVLRAGSTVGDGAVVNIDALVGSFCILNTNVTIEHDCRLGDNVHVAPGATLSGGVTIGDDCLIGAGSTVLHQVTICAGTLIGAGSTVLADITDPGVYAGGPARRIR